MAVPTIAATTTFTATDGGLSGLVNLNTTPSRRLISCTISPLPVAGNVNLAGWLWVEVRNNQNTFVRVRQEICLTANETAMLIEQEFTGLVWRLSFTPVESLTPRTGTFRIYDI